MISLHSSKKNDLFLRMNQYKELFGTDRLNSKELDEENIKKWKLQSFKDSNNNNEKKEEPNKKYLTSDEQLMLLLSY